MEAQQPSSGEVSRENGGSSFQTASPSLVSRSIIANSRTQKIGLSESAGISESCIHMANNINRTLKNCVFSVPSGLRFGMRSWSQSL